MQKQIVVKVVAGAKKNFVRQENDGWKVYTTAPAVDNKANEAVIELLAEHFSVKRRQIELVRGALSRRKIFQINAE